MRKGAGAINYKIQAVVEDDSLIIPCQKEKNKARATTYISSRQVERVTFGKDILLVAHFNLRSACVNRVRFFAILVLQESKRNRFILGQECSS